MKANLSRAHNPPAAMVFVEVRDPRSEKAATVEGKIDTGADMCTVPEWVVSHLELPVVRSIRAAGYEGAVRQVSIYRFDLEIGDMRFRHVEAVVTNRSYAIIGRSILRHLVLRIDGPRETLQLSRPRPR